MFNRVKDALGAIPTSIQDFLHVKVSLKRLIDFWNQPEINVLPEDASQPSFDNATIAWPAEEDVDTSQTFRLRDLSVSIPENGFTLVCGNLGSGKSLLVSRA